MSRQLAQHLSVKATHICNSDNVLSLGAIEQRGKLLSATRRTLVYHFIITEFISVNFVIASFQLRVRFLVVVEIFIFHLLFLLPWGEPVDVQGVNFPKAKKRNRQFQENGENSKRCVRVHHASH